MSDKEANAPQKRRSVQSGTNWEKVMGYSRAVRVGDRILVSGTSATGPDGVIGAGDPAAQTRFILERIESAITQLGGSLRDVVRTRVYLTNVNDWQEVAKIHGERFGDVRPVNTLIETRLVGEEYLVEIEAEAIVGSGDDL